MDEEERRRRCRRSRSRRPAALTFIRPRPPLHPRRLPYRPLGSTSRSPGVTTRCGGFKSNPPSLRRTSRPPNTVTGRSRSLVFAQMRRGPCLCGTQRPEHGRAHGRQAFIFRRQEMGARPVRPRPAAITSMVNSTKRGSLIHRDGTLNGIATANDARRARGRWLHSGEWTQVAIFVGRSCPRRSSRRSRRTRCHATNPTLSAASVQEATGAAPCSA